MLRQHHAKLLLVQGLRQISVATGHRSANFVNGSTPAGQHHDDRDRCPAPFIHLDGAASLITVQPGHHDVQKYKLEILVCSHHQSLFATACQQALITKVAQSALHEFQSHIAVIHDQDISRG